MPADKRFLELQIKGPFGNDAVILSFSGREQISRPFEFNVEITSTEIAIKPADVIGIPLCVRLDRGDGKERFFHGYVSHMSAGETTEVVGEKKISYRNYRVRLVPWLWFLSRAARCFVFLPEKEEKSVMEILEKALERVKNELHVKVDWDDKTQGILDKAKLEHCVQFRETDFNFLSRMLEQYGVAYYFTHTKSEHKMVWAAPDSFGPAEEASVEFPATAGSQIQKDHILSWDHSYEFVSGKYTLSDYNFKTPSQDIKTEHVEKVELKNNAKYELYDYPGEYDDPAEGKALAESRIKEEQARFDTVSGSSQCKSFQAGVSFTLASHPSCPDEKGKQYLITAITHSATQPAPITSGGSGESYTNHFEAQLKDVPYVPPRLTPKPLVSGIQTATVAGPAGEEIHTDQFGRVKIHYHWDREGRAKRFTEGEKLFSWVRVAMPMAGKGWGMVAIPRVGQEVVVNFLDGDPDCPLIVGTVFNAEQTPHYPLPAERTKSYIRTNSSPGGSGYNELMFDDTAGKERFFMHAQYDMDVVTEHDARGLVGNDRHETVGVNLTQSVGGNKNITVAADQVESIGGNFELKIAANRETTIDGDDAETVGGEVHLTIGGAYNRDVGGDDSANVGGNVHLTAGGDIAIESGPANAVHIKANTIVIEAMMQISLKVGANFIDIGPAGISIQGTMLNLNSGGAPGQGKGSKPKKPKKAKEAKPPKPAEAWKSASGSKSRP